MWSFQTSRLAKGYGDFFNHIGLRKSWRSVPFVLDDVQSFFGAAAVIVIALRAELEAARPNVVVIRMLDGSAKEYLWGIRSNPNPSLHTAVENQRFVSDLVHATMKDANGYVEGLTQHRVDASVWTHGSKIWPWVGEDKNKSQTDAAAALASATAASEGEGEGTRGRRSAGLGIASAVGGTALTVVQKASDDDNDDAVDKALAGNGDGSSVSGGALDLD